MAKVITEMNPKPMKLKFEKVRIQINKGFKNKCLHVRSLYFLYKKRYNIDNV